MDVGEWVDQPVIIPRRETDHRCSVLTMAGLCDLSRCGHFLLSRGMGVS
jgi:hypothetical protein